MFIPNTNIDLFMSDKSLQSLLNNKTLEEKAYTIANEYKEKVKKQGTKQESTHKEIHKKTAVKISSRKRESARNTTKQNIYKDINNAEFDWFGR